MMQKNTTPATESRKGEYRVPGQARLSECRSCHAPIIWARTGNDKPIPLSVASIRTDEHGIRWALSHFADCPNAAVHRSPAPATTLDLRDLPEYLRRHGLVVASSTIRDDGNGRLIVELFTRRIT